jgi:hypothetical protein
MTTGTTPGNHERFPDYDVLAQQDSWDSVTTGVVLRRLGPPPKLRFFTVGEEPVARALFDRLLAQDDEPRVPVLELIDSRLAEAETDGWRYEDMPEDGDAWRQSLRCLDDDATASRGSHFWALSLEDQRQVLEGIRTAGLWHGLPAGRMWNLWLRYACAAFYSHPWAWNEIGFGGPAYPRGYANLGLNKREHWEKPEVNSFDPEPWSQRIERARRRHAGQAESQGGDTA